MRPEAAPRPVPAALDTAAALAFLLLVATLPTSIAPMGIALGLCGALTAVVWAWRRGGWVHTPVDWAMLGWIAALLIVALAAEDRAASLTRLRKGLLPALVALAAFHAARRERGTRAVAVLLGAGAVVGAIGAGVWFAQGHSMAARARGLVGHYMTFGGQLMLWLSLAAGIVCATRERRWRLAAAALALPMLVAFAATYTRSAWIGFAVAVGVMLALTRARWLLALPAVVVAVVMVAPGAWHERLLSSFDPSHASNSQRLFMWDAGLRMFRDHPLTGVGLQDLHTVYDRYRSPLSTERAGHLHNLYIQIAASMGLVGLAAFAWLYSALIRTAGRGLRAQSRSGTLAAGVRLGVVAALVGFLVAGAFEWNFGDEELLYPLYTLVGLAWAAREWDAS